MTTLPAWLEQAQKQASSALTFPAWVASQRDSEWKAFLKAGLPTRKEERWKYTDLSCFNKNLFSSAVVNDEKKYDDIISAHRVSESTIMLVLLNGVFSSCYSDMTKLPEGVIACNLIDAIANHSDLVKAHWNREGDTRHYPFSTLNTAMFFDGLFLHVSTKATLTAPIQLLSIVSAENCFIANPRRLIVLEKNAKLEIVDEFTAMTDSTYFMNTVTQVTLDEEAKLEYVKLQSESPRAIHMAHLFVEQQKNSNASLTSFSIGGEFARDDLVVRLHAEGAECRTGGLYYLKQDNQYIDHHVDIDHRAPHSQSEMVYKGILDKASRAVFNGRLLVEKDAQKIIAYQANHNLLLSNTAEVNSKPELEIYADDVKCKHGATTGQLDEEALFYLRSRGISFVEARQMLLSGFAAEVIERVLDADIRCAVKKRLQGYL